MKYRLNLSVLEYGSVEVEADSEEEAMEKAEDAIAEGNVFWNNMKLTDVTAEPVQNRAEKSRKTRQDR